MILKSNQADIIESVESLHFSSNKAWKEPSEWLETNGLGGWASSSISCCNTRRYHGLLIAATKPPVERMALVSKLEESLMIGNKRFELGTNDYGEVIHPNGFQYITSFTKDLFPEWTFEMENVILKKTIGMVHEENTTLILYEVVHALSAFTLELLPLISVRDYHSLQHSNDRISKDFGFYDSILKIRPYDGPPNVFISIPGSVYLHHPQWYYNFNYAIEKYRGLDFTEDLFNYGHFIIELREGNKLGIIISTENPSGRNAFALFEEEKSRKQSLISEENDDILNQLTLAADQFIVKRGADRKTVIAGYHWFTDWGRDTMISLPGLCLSTKRFEEAKTIISTFAKSVRDGMLPNRFPDNNAPAEYNNVDGTLWFFIAIKKYLHATEDAGFVLGELLPVLKEIIDWHFNGTRFHIHVDKDGLLYAGEESQQLTWMDVRIGNWVVTPRMGKPVEIQALWYNALNIFAELLELNRQDKESAMVRISAEKARRSFIEKFWFKEGGYLYDVIDENNTPDATLRPNQLFAISLPYPLIKGEKANSIIKIIGEKLYTPVGLRSLPEDDKNYAGIYGGSTFERDSSYHQGTVWGWLTGAFIDAIMSEQGSTREGSFVGKESVKKIFHDFTERLNEGCIGSVSEIFDADPPHYSRGCVAQAWSVAEILRVVKDYKLHV